ncbi:unnamed protein product [Trichobilharzia regenti]|nr:unnamed protein product [Trichobilharzia regenti]
MMEIDNTEITNSPSKRLRIEYPFPSSTPPSAPVSSPPCYNESSYLVSIK